jgi:uncharacterized protein YjbI with pentapeptide repeats
LSSSLMLRIDFNRVDLEGAELIGVVAGDFLNPGWTEAMGRQLHAGVDGDPRQQQANGYERRKFVAHFIDANLARANLQDAVLEGADFSGADMDHAMLDGAQIARASFKGAQHLTVEQLRKACVGNVGRSKEDQLLEQPYLWKGLREAVEAKGGIPPCKWRPGAL